MSTHFFLTHAVTVELSLLSQHTLSLHMFDLNYFIIINYYYYSITCRIVTTIFLLTL